MKRQNGKENAVGGLVRTGMPKGNEGETFSRKDVQCEGEWIECARDAKNRKRKEKRKRDTKKVKEEIKRQNKEKTNAHEWTDSHDGGGRIAWQE